MIHVCRPSQCWHPQALWLTLLLQVPALRSLAKHVPWPVLSAVALFAVVYIMFFLLLTCPEKKPVIGRILNSRWLAFACLFLITAISIIVYPRLDAYEKSIGHDCTADDAMIITTKAFLAGEPMYSAHVYNNAPISPGPGWILLNLPFSALGAWALAAPCYLALMAWCVARLYGWRMANSMLLIFMSSANFWSLLVNGHDLLLLGIMVLLLSLLTLGNCHAALVAASPSTGGRPRTPQQVRGGCGVTEGGNMLLAILLGLTATSRIVMMAFPVLISLFLWKRRGFAALWIPLVALLIAVGLHLWAAYTVDVYPPLHLFHRADHNIGLPLIIIGAIATTVMGWMIISDYCGDENGFWFYLSLCLIVPFGFISLGELNGAQWDMTEWEGASYIWPALPVCVLALLRSTQKAKTTNA